MNFSGYDNMMMWKERNRLWIHRKYKEYIEKRVSFLSVKFERVKNPSFELLLLKMMAGNSSVISTDDFGLHFRFASQHELSQWFDTKINEEAKGDWNRLHLLQERSR